MKKYVAVTSFCFSISRQRSNESAAGAVERPWRAARAARTPGRASRTTRSRRERSPPRSARRIERSAWPGVTASEMRSTSWLRQIANGRSSGHGAVCASPSSRRRSSSHRSTSGSQSRPSRYASQKPNSQFPHWSRCECSSSSTRSSRRASASGITGTSVPGARPSHARVNDATCAREASEGVVTAASGARPRRRLRTRARSGPSRSGPSQPPRSGVGPSRDRGLLRWPRRFPPGAVSPRGCPFHR